MMPSGGGPSNAKPESLYREASTAKSTRPTGSSDLGKTSRGHTNSGFAVKQQSSATGTGIRANVVKTVKFVLEIDHNSFGRGILRNSPFVINGLEKMIGDQTAERTALNPKRGMGVGSLKDKHPPGRQRTSRRDH
jgi:hypothetical protein